MIVPNTKNSQNSSFHMRYRYWKGLVPVRNGIGRWKVPVLVFLKMGCTGIDSDTKYRGMTGLTVTVKIMWYDLFSVTQTPKGWSYVVFDICVVLFGWFPPIKTIFRSISSMVIDLYRRLRVIYYIMTYIISPAGPQKWFSHSLTDFSYYKIIW